MQRGKGRELRAGSSKEGLELGAGERRAAPGGREGAIYPLPLKYTCQMKWG